MVTTKLKDLDTSREHFVRPPVNHIVIDFDLTNDQGEKSLEKNIDAAEQWPCTYCETSRSGNGLHLHYIYDGDPGKLANVYAPGSRRGPAKRLCVAERAFALTIW